MSLYEGESHLGEDLPNVSLYQNGEMLIILMFMLQIVTLDVAHDDQRGDNSVASDNIDGTSCNPGLVNTTTATAHFESYSGFKSWDASHNVRALRAVLTRQAS